MHTFEITIQREDNGHYPVIGEEHRGGGRLPIRVEGTLSIDARELLALESDPAAYGRALGVALFQGAVQQGFVEALARIEDRLRVLLFIEDQGLRGLRWERLYAPIDDDWRLLATYQRAPFSRYLPSLTDRRFPPIGRRDLRALIVAASPPEGNRFQLTPFDVQASTAGVQAALDPIPTTLLADLPGADGRPTLDEICARITAEPYTLLHIVCHGRVLKGGESVLFLAGADDANAIDPVTGTRLIERLGGLGGVRGLPHFAFLSTCESASPDADEALGGLGQRLVRDLGMPAVVAMSDKISIATANALSAEIYRRLREHGEPDRALVEGSVQLVERGDVSVPVLFSRLGGQPLFSDSIDRALTSNELNAGLAELERLLPERGPILLPEFQRAAAGLRRTLQTAPGRFTALEREEQAAALTTIEAICSEAVELRFQQLCLGGEPPAYDGRCPFPGLRSFQGNLSEFFFGREVLVKRLADRCDSSLFLAVLGPSGSGKSSLVFAGLVPELQRREPQLPLISLTPNELPLAALLFAIEQANLPEIKEVRRQAILVIDQFEEAFTLCQDNDERRAFFAELLRLQGRFLVIITMRADFLGEVAPYPELRDRVQSQQELVAPMTPEELRRAMELQAAAVGLRFEADLSGQILDDVRGEPGAMPLLQHALQELWQRRRGRWLRSAEYRVIGGIQQAIAHSADEIYNGSSAEDQERLRGIFVRLTRLDHDHQGDEQRDTRRRVQLHDLVPSGVDPAPIRALISRLANARLVVTSGGSDSDSVEVAHEALIRSWPRLRNWLSEDRQNLLLLEAIRTAVRDWHSSGEDEGLLFRGSRLDEALALLHNQHLGLNADEQRFIEAGIALREREDAQREAARQRELEQARALAAEQEERARAERLRAEEAAAATRQLRQRAVFLAGVAVVALVAMIAAGIGFVQAAVQSGIAQSNAERAESQAATAEVARSEAEAQQQTAEAANVEAQEQRTRADTSAAESAQLAIIGDAEAALNGGRIDRSLALALAAVESGNPLARSVFALAQAADQGARQLFGGFETAVSAVAYSPDGRFVAAGDHFGLVLVWEIGNAEPIRRYQHEGPQDVGATITEVLFTADNNVLIATDSGELLLLRAADAVPFAGSDGTPIQYMALSNDGQQVFTLSAEGVLLVWDVATRQEVRTLAVIEDGEIRGMTLGANDRIIVALFADGQPPLDALREFDLETGAEVRTTDLSYATDLTDPEQLSPCFADSLAALPTQPLALVGCENGVIQLRNLNNGRLLRTLVGHDAQVLALAPVGDGSMFVSASLDQTTLLWDTERASVIERYEGHESETQVIAVAPDGERIVTGSFDRTVRLWDLRGGQRIRSYSADIQPPLNNVVTRFSADGSRITALGNERGVIWNREDGIVEAEFAFAGQSVALSPDGSLALLDDGNGLTIYDLERDEVISSLTGRPEQSVVAAFSNDNQLLVTVFDLTNAQLWDVTDGSPILDLKLEDDVLLSRAIAFNQTGTQIIGADENTIDPLIWIWDVASGTIVQRLSGHSDLISAVAFSADGTLAISGAWDRSVRIWDVSSGEELQRLIGHSQAVKSVALSADNQLVLSGSDDRTARLWEVAGGSELARYSGFNSTLVTVVFGPDGETALTSSATGDVVLWRAPSVAALVDWVYANRYLPELSCEELEQYNLTCD